MKLVSYVHNGKPGFGIVKDKGIIALGPRTNQPSLKHVLANTDALRAYANDKPDLSLDEVTFAPVVPDPAKILCVGINYAKHLAESGREKPKQPMFFTRFADTQIGHGEPMIVPKISDNLDFEGELAVVIGKPGRYIPESEAMSHVAGYTCYNDGSIRDWQWHTIQFTPGKNFPKTGAVGPWIVTPDEVPNILRASLVTRLNGQEVQRTTTDDLIFGIPKLINYASSFTPLAPGDIILSGTPSGVGAFRKPPLWMKPGDVTEVEIDGIGVLRNPIAAE